MFNCKIVTIPFLSLMFMVSAGVKAFSQNSYPEFVKQIFISGNDTLPYRLLQPEKAKSGKKYPLIIFLHGAGERGRDNEANLKYITDLFLNPYNRKKFPAFVLVPQCPPQKWWAPQNWSDKPASPADLVIRLADDLVKSYPIDVSRIYLMGLSMGGNGTWYLLTRYPDRFAAGVPICGWGNRELIPAMKDIPVWAFHGDKDPVVPAEKSRELISALQNAGGHPRYTEYKDTGHDSWTPALNEPELLKWLFSFKRPRK